jgi:hypothetical protein
MFKRGTGTLYCGTVYCVLCTVYCALCTVYCVLCTVYCVLCTVYCALCTVNCVLWTVNCELWTVYCVLCTVNCELCTVYCVLCTVNCELCTVYCVLCTVNWVLCTVYFVLWSNPIFVESAYERGWVGHFTWLVYWARHSRFMRCHRVCHHYSILEYRYIPQLLPHHAFSYHKNLHLSSREGATKFLTF